MNELEQINYLIKRKIVIPVMKESKLAYNEGKQHADCYEKAHNRGIKMSKSNKDQGFQTTHRFFASRRDASKK